MIESLLSARSNQTTSQLVVELRSQGLVVCEVTPGRASNTIHHDAVFPHAGTTTGPVSAAVSALVEHCRINGIASRSVTLLLPRSMVAIKTLSIPPCPIAERATVIRLAVAGRSTLPIDELSLGFVCSESNEKTQEVVVVTLPRRIVDQWQNELKTAGYSLAGVSVAGLVIGQAAVHGDAQSGIVIHLAGDEAYAVLLQQGLPTALAQSTLKDGESRPSQITTLVRRLPLRIEGAANARLMVSGDVTGETFVELQQLLSDTCSAFDRLKTNADDSRLAVNGWLASQRAGSSLNLLAPSTSTKHRTLPPWAKWSAAALIVVGLCGLWYGYECYLLDEQLDQYQQRQNTLARQIEQGTSLLQSVSAISSSVDQRIDWTQEMGHLIEKLPADERLMFKQIRGEIVESSGEGALRISGLAQDSRAVTAFETALLDESGRIDLFPHGMRPSKELPGYGVQFELELKVRGNTQSPAENRE